jgi:hypothetical protein
MEQLITESVITQFNSPGAVYNSGGPFRLEVPQSSVTVVRPITYEFRVAEHLDSEGNVKKVGLQVKVWEHSHFSGGAGVMRRDWQDVERVQLPFVE